MVMCLTQREIKIKPRIKLNHYMYMMKKKEIKKQIFLPTDLKFQEAIQ